MSFRTFYTEFEEEAKPLDVGVRSKDDLQLVGGGGRWFVVTAINVVFRTVKSFLRYRQIVESTVPSAWKPTLVD